MIINKVPETILQAYIPLSRRIRKGVLIRWNTASDLHTAVGCQRFRKKIEKMSKEKNI